MSRRWLGYVAVAVVALAATVAGLRNGFVQDDVVLIVENTRVHDLASWWRLFALPYWPPPWSEDLYRPLTSVLLAGQYLAGDGGALAFRLTSGLLYAGAAIAFLRFPANCSRGALPWAPPRSSRRTRCTWKPSRSRWARTSCWWACSPW